MFVVRVIRALEAKKVKFAVVGGWAVALHGAVRGTVDLDIVIALTKDNTRRAVAALKSIGVEPRLPLTADEVIDFREEYIKNRKMLAWRFINPSDSTEVVDILIIEDLRSLKTTFVKLAKGRIPILAIEELIQMKKRAGRPQDLEDIKALERLRK